MKLSNLKNVLKIVSGSELNEQEYRDLLKEAVLMTLSRGTKKDSYIHPCEVETVRRQVQALTGDEVSEADVRVAANADIYETVPFKSCLERLSEQLRTPDRVSIVNGLAEVLKCDNSVIRDEEVGYFNEVARALRVTPAQMAGLDN
jgi:uncharacterized tellurite resistance protein B-like protein